MGLPKNSKLAQQFIATIRPQNRKIGKLLLLKSTIYGFLAFLELVADCTAF
jgi:hypothetical protein